MSFIRQLLWMTNNFIHGAVMTSRYNATNPALSPALNTRMLFVESLANDGKISTAEAKKMRDQAKADISHAETSQLAADAWTEAQRYFYAALQLVQSPKAEKILTRFIEEDGIAAVYARATELSQPHIPESAKDALKDALFQLAGTVTAFSGQPKLSIDSFEGNSNDGYSVKFTLKGSDSGNEKTLSGTAFLLNYHDHWVVSPTKITVQNIDKVMKAVGEYFKEVVRDDHASIEYYLSATDISQTKEKAELKKLLSGFYPTQVFWPSKESAQSTGSELWEYQSILFGDYQNVIRISHPKIDWALIVGFNSGSEPAYCTLAGD